MFKPIVESDCTICVQSLSGHLDNFHPIIQILKVHICRGWDKMPHYTYQKNLDGNESLYVCVRVNCFRRVTVTTLCRAQLHGRWKDLYETATSIKFNSNPMPLTLSWSTSLMASYWKKKLQPSIQSIQMSVKSLDHWLSKGSLPVHGLDELLGWPH